MPIPRPLAERLAAKTLKASCGCHLWLGGSKGDKMGYGVIYDHSIGKNKNAHRAAYELANGPIPAGMHVMHKCDVPLCVNPEHLALGTNADNVADKIAKGRAPVGERLSAAVRSAPDFGINHRRGSAHPLAVLTEEKVIAIRSRNTSKRGSIRRIADEFGVGSHVIEAVIKRRTWRHI